MQGGALVAARQALSLGLSLLGTLLLTKLLGPAGYGRFAAALGIYAYVFAVAPLGLNGWLIRRADAHPDADAYAAVRALLLLSSLVLGVAVALAMPAVDAWLGNPGVAPLALAMLAALPLQMTSLLPLAALERALKYREVAVFELQGLLLFYVVAVALAWRGWGPAAVVTGWWIQVLWIWLRLWRTAGLGLRLAWRPDIAREALRFGLGYASSLWTWQLRDLVNPLIVGRAAGVDGVGIVALAIRLVEAASFVRAAVWRLSLPTLAKLQNDAERLALAVRDGMRVQGLLVGVSLLALALLGPVVVPWLFGREWTAVRSLLPLIAAGTLSNAAFNLHSSALYAVGRSLAVWRFHVLYMLLFAGSAAVLVPLLGVNGYGMAELLALPAYVSIWMSFRRALPAGDQSAELALAAGFVLAVAGSAFAPWMGAVAVLPFALPSVRHSVGATLRSLRGALGQ